jgi:hypothetical protein
MQISEKSAYVPVDAGWHRFARNLCREATRGGGQIINTSRGCAAPVASNRGHPRIGLTSATPRCLFGLHLAGF